MTRNDWSGLRLNGQALPRDVKVAVDYMRRNLGRQIHVADLLTATRVPERTLRKRFLKFFGLPPLAYFRRLRLAAARDALLATSGESITEIAARFGFTHFGRFAADYRRCFGELPSMTRRPPSPHVTLAPSLSLPAPTLTIAPFRTQGDRESNWLADSLRELLAAELARGGALSTRLTTATANLSIRRPEARYSLAGRVTRVAGRVRVIVQLIDAETDCHLWGDSFDGEAGDELSVQDLIADSVVRAVQPRILGQQIERLRSIDPGALNGWEMALKALPLALLPSTNRLEQAVDLLNEAMASAPDCGLAVALAGWCRAKRITTWSHKASDERSEACRMADQAGILAPSDPMVLAIRASIAHLTGQYEGAESLAARAVACDPICAWGWDRLGWVHEATDRPDEALPFFARAERIRSPYLDAAASMDGVGTAHFCAGRYQQAAAALKTATLVRPGSTGLHGKLAACYVQLGDRTAARAQLAKLRQLLPDVSAEQYVNSYPCGAGAFKDVLANSLTEIGMRA